MQTATTPASAAATPEWLTPSALSRMYDLTPGTWAKKRWDGSGPPYSIVGGRALYKRSDVEEWLLARRVTSCADAQARGLASAPANKRRKAVRP